MPNVDSLKESRFLKQAEVEPPKLVTITGYEEVNVAKEGADPQLKWVLILKEFDKPMTLNSTNGQIIGQIVNTVYGVTRDFSEDEDGIMCPTNEQFRNWVGKKIILYRDPNVSFGSNLVGGIRCRAPEQEHGTYALGDGPSKEPKPMGKTLEIIDQAFFDFETENDDSLAKGFIYDKDRFIKAIVKHFKTLPTNKASIRKICDTVKPDEVMIKSPTPF